MFTTTDFDSLKRCRLKKLLHSTKATKKLKRNLPTVRNWLMTTWQWHRVKLTNKFFSCVMLTNSRAEEISVTFLDTGPPPTWLPYYDLLFSLKEKNSISFSFSTMIQNTRTIWRKIYQMIFWSLRDLNWRVDFV